MGVAKRTVNPSLDVPHAGWGAQTHVFAQGIEADFYVTVMILADDRNMAAIIDVDIPLLSTEQANAIRQTVATAIGIPYHAIRLSITHTHAGPMVWSDYYAEGKESAAQYVRYLTDQTVAAAEEAHAGLTNTTIGAGYGMCSIGKNRRQLLDNGAMLVGYEPQGTADPTVGVIRFEDEAGRLLANIVFYSCHPTTLGFTYQLHSPDYPGVMKQFVEQSIGGTCLFMQGCAGNIGPGPEGFQANVAAMKRMGIALGAEAVQVSLDIEAGLFIHTFMGVIESGAPLALWESHKIKQDVALHVYQVTVPLPLKQRISLEEASASYEKLEQELASIMKTKASSEEIKAVTFKAKRAYIALDSARKHDGKTESEIEVQFICMGDIALIGTPLEPFVELGMSVREKSPFPHTFFTGYTNGFMGYLPNASDYALGGYEVERYPFAPEAAQVLECAVLRALTDLRFKE